MSALSTRPMMNPKSRRRRDFRFPARDAMASGDIGEGRLINVARRGVAIETDSRMLIGSEHRIEISCDGASFAATGQVRWCTPCRVARDRGGEPVEVYHAGLSLEEREPREQEKVLEKLRRRLLERPDR